MEEVLEGVEESLVVALPAVVDLSGDVAAFVVDNEPHLCSMSASTLGCRGEKIIMITKRNAQWKKKKVIWQPEAGPASTFSVGFLYSA